MERDVMWTPWNEPGLEHLHLVQDNEEVVADGGIIGMKEGKPFCIWYEIHCDAQWRVRRLSLDLLGRDAQWIRLQADGKGHWSTIHGESLTALNGCIDIDISATPFTNTLPIRRLQLARSQSSEIKVVYIAVPEMELKPAMQRYTCLEIKAYGRLYKYESLPSGYTNEFWVDTDGLIIDYPGLFRRVQPHE